ncbi:hypothetical protein [Acuticoccus sp. I52.16.1]|uniref:hypothetical protein n=1 Tax=Acuticoccus sp. I52.16.1 TaxID=2928472 RepID=UPI001FCFBE6D|nr:hypothetical protein [Acuticoccus sp. I52.16.1]UOM35285.1 hypothetical protein MRB58_03490 [Acuticoccus sp. I52.16.1]
MTDFGQPAIVTYAFAPDHKGAQRAAPDAALIEGMREAVDRVEAVAGVRFVEVGADDDPMVSLQYTTDGSGYSWAHYPSVSAGSPNTSSQILMSDVMTDYTPGSWGFEILLHELGHTLGLKHPHEGGVQLDAATDNTSHTLMSYNRDDPHDTYQSLDVKALQHLYGPAGGLDGVTTVYRAASDTMLVKGTAAGETLIGVNGRSVLSGGSGADQLLGRDAADRLLGGAGNDKMVGAGGRDKLLGGIGNDAMSGGAGNDRLAGQKGNDILDGGVGHDRLDGGGGHDRLSGGAGNDKLAGGRGNDVMTGGDGRDVFDAFGSGRDVVRDFDPHEGDRIDISGLDMSASEAADRLTSMRGNLVFDTGMGTLTLEGAGDLNGGEWIFIG